MTEIVEETRCVYVLEFDDGHVKIGYSENPERRIASIVGGNQAVLTRKWISEANPNARNFEQVAHRFFKKNRANGEFFRILFWDAVEFVDALFRGEVEWFDKVTLATTLPEFELNSGLKVSEAKSLGPYGYLVYSTIKSYIESTGTQPTHQDIVELCGVSIAEVKRQIAHLQETDFVQKEKFGRKSLYTFNIT